MTKPHRIILSADKGDIEGQAAAAAFSLSLGAPTGRPAFHVVEIGNKQYAVVWNKASLRVWPQQDT